MMIKIKCTYKEQGFILKSLFDGIECGCCLFRTECKTRRNGCREVIRENIQWELID